MIENEKVKKVLYGGDYNPEQWPEEIWEEDMRLFSLAGIDVVTLNVFSWAALQRDEITYDFSKLDKIMGLVKKNGLNVCLATSTGAHPAWMARKYPDILRTDNMGIKRKFGARHNSCPNSPTYRKYSVALAERLSQRYKDYDNIVSWHISNEYGGECYCENCEKAFRVWLRKKYGTIEELNRVWNTSFWGHTFYDWEDVVLPDMRSEEFSWNGVQKTNFQGISLDYKRFNSDSILECFKLERDAVKKHTPQIPVTTNLMGCYQPLDYQKWGKEMDFVSWDSYPIFGAEYSHNAMYHDVMRGVKQGKPFALMEQTPSVSNWHAYCALKRPGVMRLLSYQAMAHGGDTVMFFQMRRSIGACE
ncbi:MAG: beta-galactosidase, partial [Lachnospiraceae bacterium]|nr:beta-galactosidase [Lachnospiraceae bacterium]